MRSNSFSSVSSASSDSSLSSQPSTTDVQDTMQIFVKNIAGETFAITVPQSTSVSTLRSLVALRTNLPERDLRLVYAGKHLAPSETLSSYNVTRESTLHIALPIRGGAPKKMRCNAKDCKDAAQRIVGDCGFCQGHFCGKHRMLESHNCTGLEDCKKEERERNTQKLESERTVAIKGI
ncbi:ubiquitin-like protein [Acrodontium crateriforme]|uniref:Ubiquitin-like protein n=1 Tax=Acrodontium crateriforme TaxID=150365 RepID=A0AAQ3R786_9PEZI|nr:ubiquitin-like protein [Acrodontium crateriforme]